MLLVRKYNWLLITDPIKELEVIPEEDLEEQYYEEPQRRKIQPLRTSSAHHPHLPMRTPSPRYTSKQVATYDESSFSHTNMYFCMFDLFTSTRPLIISDSDRRDISSQIQIQKARRRTQWTLWLLKYVNSFHVNRCPATKELTKIPININGK